MKKTFALSLLAASSAAFAGAPMATEDADVLGRGECEWESSYQRSKIEGLKINALGTKVGCHALEGTQLALGVGRAKAEGESATAVNLSGKTALIGRSNGGFGLSLAYGFNWSKAGGESLRYDSTSLALVASQGFGDFTLHGNLGLAKARGASGTDRFWALGGEYALSDSTDLLAETYGAEGSKPFYGVGVRFKPNKEWAFGVMASQSRETPRLRNLLFSAKLAF